MKRSEIYYISNLITFSRFVLLAATIYLLTESKYFSAALFITLIWISDLLDGYVARKRNEISELGKIIDPIADKLSVISISIFLLIKGLIPIWFMVVIIIRDLLILGGGIYLKKRMNIVMQSNVIGKISVFFIGFTLFFFIISAGFTENNLKYPVDFWELISNVLIFISLGMILLSFIVYYIRFLEYLNKFSKKGV